MSSHRLEALDAVRSLAACAGGVAVPMWSELERWLSSSHAYDVLDDAVLGCLEDSTVMELLEDYGISWTRESRRRFAGLLDAELSRP